MARPLAICFCLFLFVFNAALSQDDISEAINYGCFKIVCYKNGEITKTGSGFILKMITSDFGNNSNQLAYLGVTNEHVIENIDSANAELVSGEKIKITGFVHSNHHSDITFIRLESNLKLKPLLDNIVPVSTDLLKLGEEIYTISSPRGLTSSLSTGIISGIRVSKSDTLIQFTAPSSPGSSGGLLATKNMSPIGVIVSQFSEGQNLNFAIPLYRFLDELRKLNILDKYYNFNNLSRFKKLIDLSSYIESSDPILKDVFATINDSIATLEKLKKIKNNYLTEKLLEKKALLYTQNSDIEGLFELTNDVSRKYTGATKNIVLFYLLFSISEQNIPWSKISTYKSFENFSRFDDDLYRYLTLFIKGMSTYDGGTENTDESLFYLKKYIDYHKSYYKINLDIDNIRKFPLDYLEKRLISSATIKSYSIVGLDLLMKNKFNESIDYIKTGLDVIDYYNNENTDKYLLDIKSKLVLELLLAYVGLNDLKNLCYWYKYYKPTNAGRDIENLIYNYCK